MGQDLRQTDRIGLMRIDMTFVRDAGWLALKIAALLLLSNAGQSFFVYQNF